MVKKEGKFQTLIYEKKENVVWITLNRPEVLNAQNETLLTELAGALEEARDDDEVHVIVLTGAGDRAFSAGADISVFRSLTPLDVIKENKFSKTYELIREIP